MQHYPYIASFIAGFFAEEILVFLGFLSGHHLISFWSVLFYGILGILVLDSSVFAFGRTLIFRRLLRSRNLIRKKRKKIAWIKKVTHQNIFLSLLLTKFIYGPRMLIVAYYALGGMSYKKFLSKDILAVLLWSAIMMPLAWMAGRGILSSFNVVKHIETTLMVAALFVIVFFVLERFVISKMLKKFGLKF